MAIEKQTNKSTE